MALNINGGLNLTSGSLNTIQKPRTSVIYDSGLIFSASVDNVELLGNTFSVTSSIITLDTADATFDRVDAIVAELSSSVGTRITKITGTPSADAAFPVLDPSNQIALKYVTVKANAVTPSTAGTNPFDQRTPEDYENIVIYREGNGLPGEWNTGSIVVWGDIPGNTFQSPEEAYVGSYSVKNSIGGKPTGILRGQHIAPQFKYSIADGNQIQLKRVAGFSFRIKLKTSLAASEPEFISEILESAGAYGQISGLSKDRRLLTYYGVNLNDTTNWQYVTFSIEDFGRKSYPSNPNNIPTSFHLGVRSGRSITVEPDDAFVYIDDIRMYLGSLPAGDPDEGGNTGTTGGTGVYKQGDTNFSIIPTNALACVTNDFSTIGGGQNNTITGSQYSYIGAGQNNIIESGSDYISILGGAYNTASADYSSVIGGQNNYVNHSDSFIIGSNLTSDKACYTFMNNLDVAGVVSGSTFSGSFVGDGSGLTNIPTSSIVNFPTEVSRSAAAAGFGSGDITRVSGSGTVAGITLSGDTTTGDACLTLGGTFSTTTSSIVDFPTEVSRSAAAAGFGSGGVTELPVGGTTGQSLVKNSDSDYDVTWSTVSGGGGNGEYVPYITGSSSSGILPRLGSNCTTIGTYATIAGGNSNNIVDIYSFIGGGFSNLVSESYSAILGGADNEVHTSRSSIAGGYKNCIHTSQFAFIGGGTLNTGSGGCSVIGGGQNNTNAAGFGFLGGGKNNTITSAGGFGAILGGTGNCLCNLCSFIIGSNLTSSADCTTFVNNLNVEGVLSLNSLNVGENGGATLGGEYSSILAGCSNDNDGKWSSIGGGNRNDIDTTATGSFLGAGCLNTMEGNDSFIGAGYGNKIWEDTCCNFIGAGFSNDIKQGCFHGILAGRSNNISSSNADFIDAGNTIVGGRGNQILQEVDGSFIGNGRCNVITGSFNFSSIIGGECNTVTTANSHIIGSCITSDKANYTYVDNIHITGSTTTNGILQLTRRETTPTGVEGMIIASGSVGSSKLYYYDGSSWNALF